MIEGKTKMTDTVRGFRARLVTAAAMSALLTAGCATTAPSSLGRTVALGENAAGDPCEATENWSDQSFGDEFVKKARSYSVGCRGRDAGGTLARVRLFDTDNPLFHKSFSSLVPPFAGDAIL